MTQTRSFLLVAWLILAFFLWDAWQKDYATPTPMPSAGSSLDVATSPAMDPAIPSVSDNPATSPTSPSVDSPSSGAATTVAPITLANDVLRLSLDAHGGSVLAADLLAYDQTASSGSAAVQLLSQDPAHYFVAQIGWVSATPGAPNHQAAFQAEGGAQALAEGADAVELPFVWQGADGMSVRRVYRLARGSYVLDVRDEISNTGATPWRGHVYRQLLRVPPPSKGGGMTNPEAYSFVGAAWYSPQDKFEKLKFDDFADEPLNKNATGGWIAMLQHYFVAAWIPGDTDAGQLSTAQLSGRYLIRNQGPAVDVAPGASARSEARLYVGPKLQDRLDGITPGLGLTLDYGVFTLLAQPMHWLLAKLHALTGNWGWAIVLLVVILKLALFKLSEAQYKSFARMRRVQPRIEALKERYGEDRQKFQQAMMELYKKEKINPMGGCLPILVQIPIFISLYWVLLESVELRHAPWIGWIQNLTAPDPFFVLPALNLLTMWLTQKLSPTPGMDPMQKKMMQIMPLVFGVMFAFFPAGLVLYWATNGALGLLQQWIITKRHGEPARAN
ncbi:MAG: membrane protein insertase YidC [Chiayiivirga sp.]|jgi:YidC/Oxa1 family membrane protein insertase|uniref:membrane protein insertase YidC n=1 Tax=Chiayiivirga sp. TaxID=2041042 RepID=UPI0025C2D41E|nr:membrane protein insertase YidC [Chiayiivirga sp.]MCI1711271.1 membrane protein insertase YidC [Chiayiivirga sp.]MCI1727925.1 membrane protein insertase YidC [Chiayiivirga sp.]